MSEFNHIVFKIICSMFMTRTFYHYWYSEYHMQQIYNLKVQKFERSKVK